MASPITSRACHVAVIGIGAAGLVAARELRREGHTVVGFEREKQVGGLWVYTDRVEPDSLSLDPDRTIVHSIIYQSLRTNLPRECMGYSDFPFVTRSGDGDPRRYPDHKEVMMYLQDFAKEFEIEEMIRFETEVLRVEPAPENNRKWRVQFKSSSGVSGEISRLKPLHPIHTAVTTTYGIILRYTAPARMVPWYSETGKWFMPMFHCTGYKYHFPFLETSGYVTVEDNRVGPLYKHVFPPALARLRLGYLLSVYISWGFSALCLKSKASGSLQFCQVGLSFPQRIPKRYTHFLTDPRGNPMLWTHVNERNKKTVICFVET